MGFHTAPHRTKDLELGGSVGGNVTQFDDGKVVTRVIRNWGIY